MQLFLLKESPWFKEFAHAGMLPGGKGLRSQVSLESESDISSSIAYCQSEIGPGL